ncbi:sheath protein [Winogradskyella phage Peternella_1]|uniref:Sheath protein n=1 Tax=Winogradskyella phage Peternella_1 TaxID=2745699 RepID=A0A8E4ZMY8_9CAUD|nr:sheath protein [Winogradskyella phage Peternella_1]QQV91580.1 sheath protein [Winogradskyella phage Peternella_1]
MSFQGVTINKLNGGLGRRNSTDDNKSILIVGMPLTGTTAALHTAYNLLQTTDAEALGITAAYDANEEVLVHSAIDRFFEICPDGELNLIPVAVDQTPTEIVATADLIAAVRSVADANVIAIAHHNVTVPDIDDHVEAVQAFVTSFIEEHRYIDAVILEGIGEALAVTPIANYPDLRAKDAPNVSVSIAQDPVVASQAAAYAKYADIGTVLGGVCVRQVNENLGSVDILNKPSGSKGREDYPLSLAGTTAWASSNLSDGRAFSELSKTDQKSLTESGYIYAGSFNGYGGVFFNSSPTCVEKADDFAYIENNRVWNKAVRYIRETLIPKVRGVVKKDPVSGFIRSSTIADWNSRLNKALEVMITDNEISGFDFYINPEQTLSEDDPLLISGQIVVDGIVFEFEVDLGLTDKL